MCELISKFINFISLFINDRATKLKKDEKRNDFYQKAFYFLRTSYASWSKDFKAPTKEEQTVQEFIEKFNKEYKKNEHFFNWRDKRRFKRYIKIARKHALLWSKPNILLSQIGSMRIKLCQKTILRKIKWLSKKTGRVEEYYKLEKQNKNR